MSGKTKRRKRNKYKKKQAEITKQGPPQENQPARTAANQESDTRNTNHSQNENVLVIIDPFFLYFIRLYEEIVGIMNAIQSFTRYATYRIISFLLCLGLFVALVYQIWISNNELVKLEASFNTKEKIWKEIIPNKTYEQFFDDMRLFASHKNYTNARYGIFIKFMKDEIIHLKTQNEEAEEVLKACTNMNILITITRSNKARGVVLMDRVEYIEKMEMILNDTSSFRMIDNDPKYENEYKLTKIITKIEKEEIYHRSRI